MNAGNAENAEKDSKRVLFQESERRFLRGLCGLRGEGRSLLPLSLRTPRSALPFRNKLSTTAYAHSSMLKTVKFESKSVKRATDSDQKRSKPSAFRHAHLNILGSHPLWR